MAYGDRDMMRVHETPAPAIIGAEHMSPMDADEELPETVYIPSERITERDAEVTLELRDTADGNRALLAYTTIELLVDCCGDGQPWVAVRGHQLYELRERSGADVILWDAALAVEDRRTRYQEGQR